SETGRDFDPDPHHPPGDTGIRRLEGRGLSGTRMHLPSPPPTPPHSPPQPRRLPRSRQPDHPVLVPPPHRRPPPRISNRTRPTRHDPIRHPHRQPRPTTLKSLPSSLLVIQPTL